MSTPQDPYRTDRDRHATTSATVTQDRDSEKPARPSIIQMTVSALTAVSATALLSFFGVWGTVFGMGLLSVLTVLGNYMYSTFIHRTADKVKQVRPVSLHATDRDVPAHAYTRMDDATRVDLPPVTAQRNDSSADQAPAGASQSADDTERSSGRLRTLWNSMIERYGRRRIALSVVAVFVVLAGTITVIELAAGKPMSNIVRDDDGGGSGTSVFGRDTSEGSGTDGSDDSDSPSETDGEDSDQQDPHNDEQESEPRDEQQDGEPSDQQPRDGQPEDEPPADEPPADEPPADAPAPEGGGTES